MVFPARAGMSPVAFKGMSAAMGFPRPRGDEPPAARMATHKTAFSPPARG